MIRSPKRLNIPGILAAVILFAAANSQAQLSPGQLSRPHSFLEGLDNCSKCHGFDQKLSSEKCLACHTFLAERIQAGKGLHARPDYEKCEVCHVEHQGRDFELIFWKKGIKNFYHSETGYKLEGKHSQLDCRACHQARNNQASGRLTALKKDLNRTFLGLSRECVTCHVDEHRGQFAACLNCHVMDGWKPASGFDHNKARFALTGKHETVFCQKCHQSVVDNRFASDKEFQRFTGLKFGQCLDCHQDAHNNKFGQDCQRCHNTSGWQGINRAEFDHSKTRFALDGKHAAVACDRCHLPGKSFKGLVFDRCQDCHSDYHRGQFAARQSKGACEECHTVAGFEPARFSLEQHAGTSYPLAGSHLAVPCNVCHTETQLADSVETIRFKFANTRCLACHKDPHKGQVDKYVTQSGCESCHIVDSWRKTSFDHSRMKLPLVGRHAAIACRACHQQNEVDAASLKLVELPLKCQGCHDDIHRGQFSLASNVGAGSEAETDCSRCHSPNSWKAEKFDHNRDSKFKLDGAHIKVACNGCHKETADDGKPYVHFKPLNTACSSCHGSKGVQDEGSES